MSRMLGTQCLRNAVVDGLGSHRSVCYLEITVVMWKAVTRSGMCRHYRGVSSSRLLQESGIVNGGQRSH